MRDNFVILIAPEKDDTHHYSKKTIAQYQEYKYIIDTLPQKITFADDVKYIPQELTLDIIKAYYFGAEINGKRYAENVEYWTYQHTNNPPQTYFKWCNQNGKKSTDLENISLFNKSQWARLNAHNDITSEHFIKCYVEIEKLIAPIKLYAPLQGHLYDFYIYEKGRTELQNNSYLNDTEQSHILKYANAFNITIEVEQIVNHIAKVKNPYKPFETFEEWQTVEIYEPLPQYNYQGQKSKEEVTHYKSRVKTQYNIESLRKAQKQIDFFKSLPLEIQTEFLADNYKICSHCQQPYNIYNGCDCGHTPPKETPTFLEYRENIAY